MNKYLVTLLVLAFLAIVGGLLSGCSPLGEPAGNNQYRTYHQADGVACYTSSYRGEFSCVQVAGNGEPDPALAK